MVGGRATGKEAGEEGKGEGGSGRVGAGAGVLRGLTCERESGDRDG